jgi:hypothetical protein
MFTNMGGGWLLCEKGDGAFALILEPQDRGLYSTVKEHRWLGKGFQPQRSDPTGLNTVSSLYTGCNPS